MSEVFGNEPVEYPDGDAPSLPHHPTCGRCGASGPPHPGTKKCAWCVADILTPGWRVRQQAEHKMKRRRRR